ncbi:hypothetical protein NST07_25990 [Paenibacillus sp. FSL L8-0340]|uniref:hypothetical protein n=1 Tax=Paenibacillus sp. FSL L8-0340 TaxID=2954685 RepID=UPI0031592275
MTVRIGKPMAPGTYVVYIGNNIVDVVYARDRRQAGEWAFRNYGAGAQIFETAYAADITREV